MKHALVLGAILLAAAVTRKPARRREPTFPTVLSGPVVVDSARFVDPYPGKAWTTVH